MRLISCYITSFGKIEDFHYEFNEGFNAIFEENGWGKTTFSVFIKSMFYGMEYSSRKKGLIERNHYYPWTGSTYGGNLVFEVNDKKYRIERTFGKTDKEDIFAIYNADTGLISTDYSENIGEELFMVDRESFGKSVYIPQMALATSMTDSLNAKMGDLSSAKDDISNFDNAISTIREKISEYIRKSKTNPGKLIRIQNQLTAYKAELEKLPALREAYRNQSQIVEQKKKSQAELMAEKAKLIEKIQRQSVREQKIGAYREKKDMLQKEQERLGKLDNFFSQGMPEMEDLAVFNDKERQLVITQKSLDELNFEEENKAVFPREIIENCPSSDDYELWTELANKIAGLRAKSEHAKLSEEAQKQLEELEFFFKKMVPTEEELAEIEKDAAAINNLDGRVHETAERLVLLKAQQNAREKNIRKNRENSFIGILLTVIIIALLMIGGISFTIRSYGVLGITLQAICYGGSVVVAVISIVVGFRKHASDKREEKQQKEDLIITEEQLKSNREQLASLEENCQKFLSNFLLTRADSMQENVYEIRRKLDQYNHLLEEKHSLENSVTGLLDDLADAQLKLNTLLEPYTSIYGPEDLNEKDDLKLISKIQREIDESVKYYVKKDKFYSLKNDADAIKKEIEFFVRRFPVDTSTTLTEQIKEIESNLNVYKAISIRAEEAKQAVESFERQFPDTENMESVEELQNQQVEIDASIVNISEMITQDRETMAEITEEIEHLNDMSEEIGRMEVLEEEYQEKYQLLEMTAEYLLEARDCFLSKYMSPLQEGLHRYLGFIENVSPSDNDVLNYELDMDLNVKFSYRGSSKSADYLSVGYQDMVALCSRLALLDVLYEKEKPLLILDDPFTNLDQDKIAEALKLLKEISKERQIVYFTCHRSRL